MCALRAACRLGWAGLLATSVTAALVNCSDGEASTTIRGGTAGLGEAGPDAAGNGSGGSAGERDADRDNSVDVADSSVDVADSSVDVADSSADVADSSADVVPTPHRVLLFSKTTGYRHDSIASAIRALESKAAARRWQISATEDASWFDDSRLDGFDVVVFLMSTGDVLDEMQQAAFERFVRKGRGWVGVHSASDTEYGWPWYGELVGAYFAGHPAIQPARLHVERPNQPSTRGLPAVWQRTDEWYSFSANPRSKVNVLLSLDETSYDPAATAMGDHPIAWDHAHDGGRAFYTALGHTTESWSESAFLDHVAGGIEWAAGAEAANRTP